MFRQLTNMNGGPIKTEPLHGFAYSLKIQIFQKVCRYLEMSRMDNSLRECSEPL